MEQIPEINFEGMIDDVFGPRSKVSTEDKTMPDWLRDSVEADRTDIPFSNHEKAVDDDYVPDWLRDISGDKDERDFDALLPTVMELKGDSDRRRREVAKLIPVEDEAFEIREVDAAPEYPGAPYEDEMFGNLHLGPELPGLMKQLEDPTLSDQEKHKITWEISKLHVVAAENNAWWDGNLNKRKTTKIESREPINHRPQNERPTPTPVEIEEEVEPVDEQEVIDVESEEEPESGNRITRWFKDKIQGIKDFTEYTNRHRIESKALAFVGGFAGASSAVIGAEAAMIALSIPLTAGLSVPIGMAAGLLVNYGLFSTIMRKGIEKEAKNQAKKYDYMNPGNREAFLKNIELDKKGRMKAFAYGDFVGKVVGGTVLSNILFHHDVAPTNNEHQVNSPSPEGTDTSTPAAPTEPSTGATASPEITQSPGVGITTEQVGDYVVKASDNSWEQVLAQNNLETAGPDSIKALSMNRDNIINMLTKWASTHGGNGTVPIEMGPDSVLQETPVSEVAKMLDEVIRNGYPTEVLAKQDYAEYARQLANYERVTKWVLPGTHLQFPVK